MYDPELEAIRRWEEYMDTLYEEGYCNAIDDADCGRAFILNGNYNYAYTRGYMDGIRDWEHRD